MILKKHTNELLKVLIEAGFDVTNFEFERFNRQDLGESVLVKFKGSKLYFALLPASTENLNTFYVHVSKFLPTYPVSDLGVFFQSMRLKRHCLNGCRLT